MLNLRDIKGVGENIEKKLNELGITNVFELFSFIPSKYIDLKTPIKFLDAELNQTSLFDGRVEKISDIQKYKNNYFYVIFSDNYDNNKARLKANFYNMPFLHNNFKIGDNYKILSKITSQSELIVSNPILEKESDINKLTGIYTIYPLKGLIGQNVFKNIINNALSQILSLNYSGDLGVIYKELSLIFSKIHKPNSIEEAHFYISELAKIDLAISLSIYKKTNFYTKLSRKVFYKYEFFRNNDFNKLIPFDLTSSQVNAINDINSDLSSNFYMSRIISGDVGSGKTIVAFYAMYLSFLNGYQSCLLAPTEILAKQHLETFNSIFSKIGLSAVLLTSSTSRLEKECIYSSLRSGEISCIIGTQSLLSQDLIFKNLSLAIIDEQHKFGVSDRKKLENKGAKDVLSLTATPIPRTMSLTFYEDLDVSKIERRISAKTNISTYITSNIADVLQKLINEAINGYKVFIVCPAIYDIEGNEFYSIEKFIKEFNFYLKNTSYLVLHSKLSNDEKNSVINEFINSNVNILISTSVVEVGIDTNASYLFVLNADRFGLSSLHQLRGRIGRRGQNSICFLHNGSKSKIAFDRLQIIKNNLDGHTIAEYDFSNRGPGEFLGLKQSGQSKTPIFGLSMTSQELLKAKEYSNTILIKLSLSQLQLLVRNSQLRFNDFIENIKKVTLNS